MNNDFLNLKDQQVLYEIKDYLLKIPMVSTIMEASADFPYNMLIAVNSEQTSVNMMYVPLPEDHFNDIRLMQLYSLLIQKVPSDQRNDLLTLANELNDRCPIGSFFINEKTELGFKYIFPLARFDMPKEGSLIEIFTLYLNSLMSFRDIVIRVGDGTLLLKDALKELNKSKD
ncbi:MAG: YbjN domain-containing protein [Sphingobacterium thalpophilum]